MFAKMQSFYGLVLSLFTNYLNCFDHSNILQFQSPCSLSCMGHVKLDAATAVNKELEDSKH